MIFFVFLAGIVTNCSIKTMDSDMALNFDFNSLNVNNKIIMKADGLKECFSEINPNSEVVELLMSPDRPYFRCFQMALFYL